MPGQQGNISDEIFYATVAIHDPLWRYIIQRYTTEVYGKNLATVNVIGYEAFPVGIELSQWSYPINFITSHYDDIKKAHHDAEVQAGFIDKYICFPFWKNIPQATVVCFIGVLDELAKDADILKILDLYLRRCNEVVCAVKIKRDWGLFLEGKYDYDMKEYPSGKTVLLSIRALSHESHHLDHNVWEHESQGQSPYGSPLI